MTPPAPNDDLTSFGARRCTARRADGQRCTAAAIKGSNVCRVHGGSAPHVQRAARLRLLELVDPAITALAKIMKNEEAPEAARLRAAENILDRAGYPRAIQVDRDGARELLKQRILTELAKRAADEQERLVGQALEVVEGTVVEDQNAPQDAPDAAESDEQPPPVHPDTPGQPEPPEDDQENEQ